MAHLFKDKKSKFYYVRYKYKNKWVKKSLKTADINLARKGLAEFQMIEMRHKGFNFITIDKNVKELF